MIKPFRGIFFALLIALSCPLIAQGAGFTVTPMLQEVILNDDQKVVIYEASVTNETDDTAMFDVSAIDFGSLDESGGVAFLGVTGALEERYALASWMQSEMSEVTLRPGETRSIRVQIENRETLSPGGHYGALVFKTIGVAGEDASSVAINQIFASLVLVKKTGGAKYGLELISVDRKEHWLSLSTALTLRFKNPGNVHVVPRGEVRVTDPFGRLVYRGIVNEGSTIVFPETFREYPLKLFSVKKAFIPGYYTTSLSYRYDGKDTVETWSNRQIYIPPMAAGVIPLPIVGLMASWLRYRKSRKVSI
ncbi:MAG: hypothetical protein WAT81_05145 [Candidatus Moraniibacteriota bacterium]